MKYNISNLKNNKYVYFRKTSQKSILQNLNKNKKFCDEFKTQLFLKKKKNVKAWRGVQD